MSATAPELTARWAAGDLVAFRRRMGTGLRTMLAIIVPAAAGRADPGPAPRGPGRRPRRGAGREHRAHRAWRSPCWPSGSRASASSSTPSASCSRCRTCARPSGSTCSRTASTSSLAVALGGPLRGAGHRLVHQHRLHGGRAVVALAYVRARVQGLGGDVRRPAPRARRPGHGRARGGGRPGQQRLGLRDAPSILLGRVVLGTVAGGGAYVLAAGPWPSSAAPATAPARRAQRRTAATRPGAAGHRRARGATAPGSEGRRRTPAGVRRRPSPARRLVAAPPGRAAATRAPAAGGPPAAAAGAARPDASPEPGGSAPRRPRRCSRLAGDGHRPTREERWRASRSSPTAPAT